MMHFMGSCILLERRASRCRVAAVDEARAPAKVCETLSMRDWGLHSVKFIFFYQIRKEKTSQFDQKWHARFLVSLLAKLIRF